MSKILVTGGLGFIGSHIVDELCRVDGNEVGVVDVKSGCDISDLKNLR